MPRRERKPVMKGKIIFFCALTGIYWFALYTYVPIVASYANTLGASAAVIGLIGGAYGFVQMSLRIPMGIISDKIGRRKPFIILGMAFAALAGVVVLLVQSPASLLVARALGGVAAAAWVQYTVLFASYFPPAQTPKAISYMNAMCNAGQLFATLISGFAAAAFGNISAFAMAAAVGGAGVILAFFTHEPPKDPERKPLRLSGLIKVAGEKNVLLVSVLAIIIQFMVFASIFGFTPLIAEELGAAKSELGIMTALFTLFAVAGAFSCGRLAAAFGERRTLAAGFILTGIACIATPFAGGKPVLYLLQVVLGYASCVTISLLMALVIRDVQSERRATAMGFFQAVYGIGVFLGPVFVGAAKDVVGSYAIPYAALALLGAVGAVMSIFMYGRPKRARA